MKYEYVKTLITKDDLLRLYPVNSDSMICEMYGIQNQRHLLKLLKEYGIQRHTQDENTKMTCMHKYGVESVQRLDEVAKKREQTCLSKYGYTSYLSTKESEEKAKQTIQEKYGVDNVFQLQDIKDKAKETKLRKYGNENFVNHKQSEETKLLRYGDKHYTNKEKALETIRKKYGTEHVMSVPEIKDKVKQTIYERYGVDYYCVTDDCRQLLAHHKNSKPNQEFEELLTKEQIKFEKEFHIDHYFYDFKVGNTLIEINPSATHNSTWGIHGEAIKKDYHNTKSMTAKDNGFSCVHIWDWDNTEKIVNLLLKDRKRIYARNCEVTQICKTEASEFINQYHLQGDAKASIYIGLKYNGELVSVMTFGKPRYNNSYEYELVRYCSKYSIIGGSQKLFKYFIKEYSPRNIISYCDLSKFNGNTYIKLGFTLKKVTIGKHWYNLKTNQHITDNLLRQRGFDQLFKTNYGLGTSNEELMKEHGFVEVYDSGQATYILNL